MIRVNSDGSIRYPYRRADFKAEYPNTSEPADFEAADLADFGVYPVQRVAPPTPPNERTFYNEGVPVLVAGVWQQTWAAQTIPLAVWRAGLSCSRYQFWRALRARGLRETVTTWLNAQDEDTQDRLRQLARIRRLDLAFEKLRTDNGYTPAQGDDLFVAARGIEE